MSAPHHIPKNRKVDPAIARKLAIEDGLSCSQIARHFNSSGQAVADALARQGLDPHVIHLERLRIRRETRIAARNAEIRERRLKAAQTRYAGWFPLWNDGRTLVEMAAILGTTANCVAWTVHKLRRRYGWFPRRIAPPIAPNVRVDDTWHQLWADGLTVAQLAERVGCSVPQANRAIYKMRKLRGWFPYRLIRKQAA